MKMLKEKRKDAKRFLCYLFAVFVLSLFLVTFVVQKIDVIGNSMFPTLFDGSSVFVNKILYHLSDPKRFDIIVFRYRYQDDQFYIKRIIGLPGETVQILDGDVYINGEKLKETYASEAITDSKRASEPVLLGEDEYFVLGDNRNQSSDSRSSDVGNVKKDQILGKAFWVIWPMDQIKILKHQ